MALTPIKPPSISQYPKYIDRKPFEESIYANDGITRTGNLGQTPILEKSEKGNPWLKFSLARKRKKKFSYETEWLNFKAFGEVAHRLANDGLQKGDTIRVSGELHIDRVVSKDGVYPRDYYTVYVNSYSIVKRQLDKKEPEFLDDDISL